MLKAPNTELRLYCSKYQRGKDFNFSVKHAVTCLQEAAVLKLRRVHFKHLSNWTRHKNFVSTTSAHHECYSQATGITQGAAPGHGQRGGRPPA